jgi:hypothetical protein
MKKFVFLSSVIAFAALAVGPTVDAQTNWQSGMACLPYQENDAMLVRASAGHWMGHADTAAGHTLVCPVQNNATTVDQAAARVEFTETSTLSSVGANVRFYNESTGTLSAVGWKYSCATAGGCATANHAWAGGDGYISWGNVLGAMTGSPSVAVDVSLGKTDAAGEFAWVTQYQVTY